MSILTAIQAKQQQTAAAYTACDSKGATMPTAANQTITNLADTIDTITAAVPINQKVQKVIVTKDANNNPVYSRAAEVIGATTEIAQSKYEDDTTLVSVLLPDTITRLNSSAFKNCSNLKYINLQNVMRIDSDTFLNNSYLEIELNLSDLTTLGTGSFQNTGITKINNLGSITSIDWYTFKDCGKLIYVKLPASLTYLNHDCFANTTSLIEADLSDTQLTSIPSGFSGSSVQIVYLPNSVISINGFYGCRSLETIDLSNVTSIGDWSFTYDAKLKNIGSLTNVTSIGTNAFQQCDLDDFIVNLPNLTSLGGGAFNETNIKSVTNLGTVTSVGINNCPKVTSITLPSTITSIPNWGFYNNKSMTTLTVNATTPPTLGGNALYDCNALANIYVPSASVNAYTSASGWSAYANIISAIPS